MKPKYIAIVLYIISFAFCVTAEAKDDGMNIIFKNKTGNPEEVKVYDRCFGLIIGIDKYANLGPDKQLSYCVKDAKGVRDVLESRYGFTKIETLFDGQATRDGILGKFASMQSGYKIGDNDALFVFIASHGITFGDLGYIVPCDGSFSETEYYKNISMLNLKDEVGKLVKAKHIFYVIDACYSGTILETRGDVIKNNDDELAYMKEITKENVRYALTAGDKGQTVLDGGPKGHSVFTGRFIEALEEVDGFITAPELSSKISRKVFSDAKDRGHVQSPKHGYLSGMGEFVFITKTGNSLLGVENELTQIAKEKNDIDEKIKQAKSKEEKARLELELQKKKAEEEKMKLEQVQLAELEARREEGRKRIQEIEDEYATNKVKQEAGLVKIAKANEEKRKSLEELSKIENTGESAIRQITETELMIAEIRASYESARKKALEDIKAFYKDKYNALKSVKKDPWEKQSEFEERKKIELETYTKNEYDETSSVNKRYDEEIAKSIQELGEKVAELKNKRYKLYGKDVKIVIGDLDVEKEVFPITVTSLVKQLPWSEKLEYSIKSSTAKERKDKYQKVMNTAKAEGYEGEFVYVIRYDEKSRSSKPILWEARAIELTGNNVEVASKSIAGIVTAPLLNPPSGTHTIAQNVLISTTTSGATIRFTLDGSIPTPSHGTIFSSPINISSTLTLRAIAYREGWDDSPVTIGTYRINFDERIVPDVNSGSIYTSVDGGVTWEERVSAGSRKWASIVSSADGKRLAACVAGGCIYTSIDGGATWTERTSAESRGWESIVSSSEGTKLASCVGGGYIYSSFDGGVTWMERAVSKSWSSIVSSSDGRRLAGCIYGGTIYISVDDGATWTEQSSVGFRNWSCMSSSSDGTRLAASVNGGDIYTSLDRGRGLTWTDNPTAGHRNWTNIVSSSDGVRLAACVDGGYIYTSVDGGVTWTERASAESRRWTAMASSPNGSMLTACAMNDFVYASADGGATWTKWTSAGSRRWSSIAVSSDFSKIAIVAAGE